MTKRKKRHTIIYKTLHRKLKIQQGRLWNGQQILFHQLIALWFQTLERLPIPAPLVARGLCQQTLEGLPIPAPLVARVVLLYSGRVIRSCSTSGTRGVSRLWKGYQFLFHQWHALCNQTLEGLSLLVPLVARVVLLDSGRVISSCSTSGTRCAIRLWKDYQFLFHQWHTLCYQTLAVLSVPVPLVAHVV